MPRYGSSSTRKRPGGATPRNGRGIIETEHYVLHENDWVPNNDRLAVLLYRGAVEAAPNQVAAALEGLFGAHGWLPRWRDTIFDYHHYHSTAHEALGVASGHGTLCLGGPGGRRVVVNAGDALVLPVGVGHCRLEVSDDFLVVGAYPDGQHWDICRDAPTDAARRRMRGLAIPDEDPITGKAGPLRSFWKG